MKTPEDYMKEASNKLGTPTTINDCALFALKAMQEDHEKELIAFAEYYDNLSPIEKCTVHAPNGSGTGLYLKQTKDILTQFKRIRG